MKYLDIYWMWIDWTISITIEKFDSCDFKKKTIEQIFHSNKHKCVKKKHFDEKLLSFENDKNYVEGLCIKIYQNVKWIKEKLSQKYTKIYPKIVHFFT
jgi:hypothetical protein